MSYACLCTLFVCCVQIYDPANKRYEVPFDPPGFGTKPASLAYTVAYTKFPFGFSVTRKSTGTVMYLLLT